MMSYCSGGTGCPYRTNAGYCRYTGYNCFEQILAKSDKVKEQDKPTESEPVKHGHWVDDFCSFVCSVCGGRISDSTLDNYSEPRYCPNCGAKMDEVNE